MISWKDCIVPYGKRVVPPPVPFPLPKKRVPVRCSTCGNKECRVSGRICDWTRCKEWRGCDE